MIEVDGSCWKCPTCRRNHIVWVRYGSQDGYRIKKCKKCGTKVKIYILVEEKRRMTIDRYAVVQRGEILNPKPKTAEVAKLGESK